MHSLTDLAAVGSATHFAHCGLRGTEKQCVRRVCVWVSLPERRGTDTPMASAFTHERLVFLLRFFHGVCVRWGEVGVGRRANVRLCLFLGWFVCLFVCMSVCICTEKLRWR